MNTQDFYLTILESLPTPALVLDAEDRLLYLNLAGENFLHISSTRAMHSKEWARYMPPEIANLPGAARQRQSLVWARDILLSGTAQKNHIGGHPLSSARSNNVIHAAARPLLDQSPKNGTKDAHLVLFIYPQHSDGLLEAIAHRRDQLQQIEYLSALLTHEIKNALSGIRGAAQFLAPSLTPENSDLADLIVDESDRIARLIDQVETIGATMPSPSTPVNIHEIIDRAQAVAEKGFASGIPIKRLYDPSLPDVQGDFDRLVQVFINLIKNAAEALESAQTVKGEIRLITSYASGMRQALDVDSGHAALPIMVTVEDNGPGIDWSLIPRLFTPFDMGAAPDKNAGNVLAKKLGQRGIGLALSARIIYDHGGYIDVDTQPDRTRFQVFLPLYKPTGKNRTDQQRIKDS